MYNMQTRSSYDADVQNSVLQGNDGRMSGLRDQGTLSSGSVISFTGDSAIMRLNSFTVLRITGNDTGLTNRPHVLVMHQSTKQQSLGWVHMRHSPDFSGPSGDPYPAADAYQDASKPPDMDPPLQFSLAFPPQEKKTLGAFLAKTKPLQSSRVDSAIISSEPLVLRPRSKQTSSRLPIMRSGQNTCLKQVLAKWTSHPLPNLPESI